MKWVWSFLYSSLWLAYLVFSLAMFARWNTQVLIPVFPLLAIGAWLYGRTIGLLLAMLSAIYHGIVSSVIYSDIYIYYEDRMTGALLGISIVYLLGRLRESFNDLKDTNAKLDHRIAERNTELNHLTVKLINDAEATRIRHGQTLHDGIGQELTGIQLYCTSLAEQLIAENNPLASLAFSMRSRAEKAHNLVRKTARMLFPVRIQETGLIPAINEMVSCLTEIKHLSIVSKIRGDFEDIPEDQALALYRICHESAMCAVTELDATKLHLDLCENEADYQLSLRQDGSSWSMLKDTIEQRLILYRLRSLEGMVSIDGHKSIIYRIPKVV